MKTLNRPKEVTISTSTVEGVEATDDFDTWFADMMATIEADFQESMETQARINNGYARRKELREKCRALTEPLREDTNGTGAGHLITGIAIEELKEQFGNKLTADRSFPNTDYMFLHELCKKHGDDCEINKLPESLQRMFVEDGAHAEGAVLVWNDGQAQEHNKNNDNYDDDYCCYTASHVPRKSSLK